MRLEFGKLRMRVIAFKEWVVAAKSVQNLSQVILKMKSLMISTNAAVIRLKCGTSSAGLRMLARIQRQCTGNTLSLRAISQDYTSRI